MRILLVEDDAMLADAVARALRQSAHAVEVAADGEQAAVGAAEGDGDVANRVRRGRAASDG